MSCERSGRPRRKSTTSAHRPPAALCGDQEDFTAVLGAPPSSVCAAAPSGLPSSNVTDILGSWQRAVSAILPCAAVSAAPAAPFPTAARPARQLLSSRQLLPAFCPAVAGQSAAANRRLSAQRCSGSSRPAVIAIWGYRCRRLALAVLPQLAAVDALITTGIAPRRYGITDWPSSGVSDAHCLAHQHA